MGHPDLLPTLVPIFSQSPNLQMYSPPPPPPAASLQAETRLGRRYPPRTSHILNSSRPRPAPAPQKTPSTEKILSKTRWLGRGVTEDIRPSPRAQQLPQVCPWYLKIHRNWAIGHTEVQGLDVLPLPDVHPGVVGHGREASRDLGVRSQGHVLQGIQLLKLLGGKAHKDTGLSFFQQRHKAGTRWVSLLPSL